MTRDCPGIYKRINAAALYDGAVHTPKAIDARREKRCNKSKRPKVGEHVDVAYRCVRSKADRDLNKWQW